MKADPKIKTADFFSLAQSWYLGGVHTDITVRCAGWTKPVFRCHKIIIGEILIRELGTDLSQLDPEVDELIIPDILPHQFLEFIRFLYGFEGNLKENQFTQEVHLNPYDFKVKLEEDEENNENIPFVENCLPIISLGQKQGTGGKEPASKVCPFCQKSFKRHDHLTRHLLQHTGERPYQCNLCEKAFTRKDKLNHHYKKSHVDKVFVCFCSKIFFDESQFELHIKSNPDHFEEPSEVGRSAEAPLESPPTSPFSAEHACAVLTNQNKEGCDLRTDDNHQAGEMHFKTEVDELDMDDDTVMPPLHIDTGAAAALVKVDHAVDDDKDDVDVKPDVVKKQKRKKKKDGDAEDAECEGGGRQYPCQYCHIVFTTLKKRKAHYIGDHYELLKENGLLFTHNKIVRIKVHVCPVDGCERSFRHSCEVQDHVNVVHKKEKNYVCELCSKAFPYKKSLRNHMDLKHDVHKKEAILCPKCGDIFNSKAKLSAHIASKHKVRVAKFMCKFCDFKTHAKNVITEHERTHTGEKPEICQWCGKGFNAKKTLRNHERLHTGEKPYQCKLCSSSFAQRTSLNVHMNSHHKTELTDDISKDEKPYLYKYNSSTDPAASDQQQQQRMYQQPSAAAAQLHNNHSNLQDSDQNDNNSVVVKPEITSGGDVHPSPPPLHPNQHQHHHAGGQRSPVALDSRSSMHSDPRSPIVESRSVIVDHYNRGQGAGGLREHNLGFEATTRTKVAEEATLLSLKAIDKLKNNDNIHNSGAISYPAWMKE